MVSGNLPTRGQPCYCLSLPWDRGLFFGSQVLRNRTALQGVQGGADYDSLFLTTSGHKQVLGGPSPSHRLSRVTEVWLWMKGIAP